MQVIAGAPGLPKRHQPSGRTSELACSSQASKLAIHASPNELTIRELVPGDRRAVSFIFEHLSPQSRYQRFLYPKHELSRQELDEFTCLDHWHHEALIAWLPQRRTPVGIVRYVRADDFDCAEIAITVIDEWQRRGIGRALLWTLRDRADRAGIRRFTSTILWANRAALRLAHELGSCRQLGSAGGIVELECRWG